MGGIISILYIIFGFFCTPIANFNLATLFANQLYTTTRSEGRKLPNDVKEVRLRIGDAEQFSRGTSSERINCFGCKVLLNHIVSPFIQRFKIKSCPCRYSRINALLLDVADYNNMMERTLDLVRLTRKWRLTGIAAAAF